MLCYCVLGRLSWMKELFKNNCIIYMLLGTCLPKINYIYLQSFAPSRWGKENSAITLFCCKLTLNNAIKICKCVSIYKCVSFFSNSSVGEVFFGIHSSSKEWGNVACLEMANEFIFYAEEIKGKKGLLLSLSTGKAPLKEFLRDWYPKQ